MEEKRRGVGSSMKQEEKTKETQPGNRVFISEQLFRYGPNKHKEMKNLPVCVLWWVLLAGDGYRCFDFGKKKSMREPLYKEAKWRPSH